jgi:MFS family permease
MLRPYAEALRQPGAARFSTAGLVGRSTMAMSGLGIVLLVQMQTGSYTLAGILVAAVTLAMAISGPVLSKVIDRHGQARVAAPLAIAYAGAVIAFVIAIQHDVATPVLILMGLTVGACQPMVGSLVRARWAHALSGDPRMRAAFAWESLLDEAVFVIGPPVATVMALQFRSDSPLIAVAALTLIGTLWLVSQRETAPPPRQRNEQSRGIALRFRGMVPLVVAFVMLGMVFAGFEVTTIAFADENGVRSLTGVLLGTYAAGSLIAAMLFGAIHSRRPWRTQFAVSMTAVAVFLLPLPFLTMVFESPVLPLGICAFIAGFAVSPSLISGFALAENLVPGNRITEGLTWVSTGIFVGLAAASALSGALVDAFGSAAAYGLVAGVGIIGAVTAWIGWMSGRTTRTVESPRAETNLNALQGQG